MYIPMSISNMAAGNIAIDIGAKVNRFLWLQRVRVELIVLAKALE